MIIDKIYAFVLYLGILFLKAIMYPYGLLMYPLAYHLRGRIRYNPVRWAWLWIVLDDEDDYGEPFFIDNIKNTRLKGLWLSYKWAALRNNCTNLSNSLKIPHISESLVSGKVSVHPYDGVTALDHRRFKWEYYKYGDWIGGWTVNQGERLSEYYSTCGRAFAWYWAHDNMVPLKDSKVLLWRMSGAFVWKGIMIYYKFGFNDKGQVLFDIPRISKFRRNRYTYHWEMPESIYYESKTIKEGKN